MISCTRIYVDLIFLMDDISNKIRVHLSSWNVMSNLVEAYSTKSVQMWKDTVDLRESLSWVLKMDKCHGMEKGMLNLSVIIFYINILSVIICYNYKIVHHF